MGNHAADIERMRADRDLEGLINLLTDRDHCVRKEAVLALGAIGEASCVIPLTQRFADEYLHVREATSQSLLEIGSQAVEPLIKALENENRTVREGVVQTLGKLGDSRAVYPLIEALKDTPKKRVSDALRDLGPVALEPLIRALKNENRNIRMGAASILGEMGNPAALKPLTEVLKDEDPMVREFARSAIHWIKRKNRKKSAHAKK